MQKVSLRSDFLFRSYQGGQTDRQTFRIPKLVLVKQIAGHKYQIIVNNQYQCVKLLAVILFPQNKSVKEYNYFQNYKILLFRIGITGFAFMREPIFLELFQLSRYNLVFLCRAICTQLKYFETLRNFVMLVLVPRDSQIIS